MADSEEQLTPKEEECLDRTANLIHEERKEHQTFQKHLVAQLAKITELLEKKIQRQWQFIIPTNQDVQELKTKEDSTRRSTDQELEAITIKSKNLEGSMTNQKQEEEREITEPQ